MIRSVVLVVALSGCSVVFTRRPPPAAPPPVTYPDCTTHYVPQIIDGLVAVLATSGAIYFAESNDKTDNSVGVIVEGGIALGFGLSALMTISRPGNCRAARDAFATARPQGGYGQPPPSYPPPSYPPPAGGSYPPPPR